VVVSDDGGLPEASLGVARVIPIVAGRLRRRWNGDLVFRAPPCPVEPWRDALEALLGDRARYEEESARVAAAARKWIDGLSIAPLVSHLSG
jgi:hypothetical protein